MEFPICNLLAEESAVERLFPEVAASRIPPRAVICFNEMNMSLPPCHSRHELSDEPGVFFCRHPLIHALDNRVTAEVCACCSYWKLPPPENPRAFVPGKPRSALGPCRHLGGRTGERECPSCLGSVRLKLFACHHPLHEEITLAECTTCADFEPRSAAEG